MPRTTVADVRMLLAHTGYTFSDAEIERAISDASDNFVSWCDLTLKGNNTEVKTNKLVDQAANFKMVKPGAVVRNLDTGAETTVTNDPVSRTEIPLTDDIFPEVGAAYEVEDYARVEMAERYKAASLLVMAASGAAQGISSASLGPFRVTMGSLGGPQDSATNEFERKYLEIVGPVAVVGESIVEEAVIGESI